MSLLEDRVPAVVNRGWLPAYVDLWKHKDRAPALLLADVVRKGLASFEDVITMAAKMAKLNKITVLGTLNLDQMPSQHE